MFHTGGPLRRGVLPMGPDHPDRIFRKTAHLLVFVILSALSARPVRSCPPGFRPVQHNEWALPAFQWGRIVTESQTGTASGKSLPFPYRRASVDIQKI